jgi:hypothetical protein
VAVKENRVLLFGTNSLKHPPNVELKKLNWAWCYGLWMHSLVEETSEPSNGNNESKNKLINFRRL